MAPRNGCNRRPRTCAWLDRINISGLRGQNKMIIIAFSTRTSKIIPRILCRRFKHVAVIIPVRDTARNMIMKQFIKPGRIANISLCPRDIRVLSRNGWRFVYVTGRAEQNLSGRGCITCVAYAKRALGLRRARIQTPCALYKYLNR